MGVTLTASRNKVDYSLYSPVIKALLYFDIFHYPITADEIFKFLSVKIEFDELSATLSRMEREGLVYKCGNYYSVHEGDEIVLRRERGNKMAERLLPQASSRAALIARFPFVRAVMGSGSLSKGYMDENSDFDFFIVTEENRLWIARMILVLYKRLFLKNSSREFCVNYFVTKNHLTIEEQNSFTATELATVIPFVAHAVYVDLLRSNLWLYNFFPNYQIKHVTTGLAADPWYKAFSESLINLFGGKIIDKFCMWLTQRRWERMYRKEFSSQDFNIAFKSRKDVSKGHPKHYQRKVTELMEEKWKWYVDKFSFQPHE